MTVSVLSPFRFREDPRPSIFMAGGWGKASTTGKSMSTLQTQAVAKATKRDGRNPGSIRGLSAKGNLLIEESEHQRRAKR